MRAICSVCTCLVLLGASVHAENVQLFNTSVLGTPTSKPVKLLLDKASGDVEPFVIWTDVGCGRYFAASVFYQKPITFDSLHAAVNKRLASFETRPAAGTTASNEPPMALWRIVDPAKSAGVSAAQGRPKSVLAIQLTNADDEAVRLIYILTLEPKPACETR